MRLPNPLVRSVLCAAGLMFFAGCFGGLPPLVSEVKGPTRVVAGQLAACTTDARLALEDSVSIRFAWGDGDTSQWSEFVYHWTRVSATHVWSDPGGVIVKAQARTRSGLVSEWLGGLRLTVLDSSLVKWIALTGPIGATCPAVGPDGTVYVATSDGMVALDREGKEKWRSHQFDDDHSPAVSEEGAIYVLRDRLYKLAPDGTVLFADSLAGGNLHSPAIGPDGTIYASRRDTAVAINPDGSLKWESPVPGNPQGCPAVGTDSSICWVLGYVDADSPSVCVFGSDGTRRWSAQVSDAQWVSAGERGSFAVVSGEHRCFRFDSLGTPKAEYVFDGGDRGPAVTGVGPEFYITTGNGLLVALPDSQSRTELREWDLGMSALLDADGNLYFGGDSAYEGFGVFRLGADPWADPLVRVDNEIRGAPGIGPDGTIYIGSSGGYVFALRGGAALAGTSWPKFAHDSRNSSCAAGH
jgi:hypothetical protein